MYQRYARLLQLLDVLLKHAALETNKGRVREQAKKRAELKAQHVSDGLRWGDGELGSVGV